MKVVACLVLGMLVLAPILLSSAVSDEDVAELDAMEERHHGHHHMGRHRHHDHDEERRRGDRRGERSDHDRADRDERRMGEGDRDSDRDGEAAEDRAAIFEATEMDFPNKEGAFRTAAGAMQAAGLQLGAAPAAKPAAKAAAKPAAAAAKPVAKPAAAGSGAGSGKKVPLPPKKPKTCGGCGEPCCDPKKEKPNKPGTKEGSRCYNDYCSAKKIKGECICGKKAVKPPKKVSEKQQKKDANKMPPGHYKIGCNGPCIKEKKKKAAKKKAAKGKKKP